MDEIDLRFSPLCQDFERGGHAVRVEIYCSDPNAWILEVEDEYGNSTVWNEYFETDAIALAEFHRAVGEDGIESMVYPDL